MFSKCLVFVLVQLNKLAKKNTAGRPWAQLARTASIACSWPLQLQTRYGGQLRAATDQSIKEQNLLMNIWNWHGIWSATLFETLDLTSCGRRNVQSQHQLLAGEFNRPIFGAAGCTHWKKYTKTNCDRAGIITSTSNASR